MNEASVLFAKVGPQVAVATESGKVSTYSLDGKKYGRDQCEVMLVRELLQLDGTAPH